MIIKNDCDGQEFNSQVKPELFKQVINELWVIGIQIDHVATINPETWEQIIILSPQIGVK